MLDEYKFIILFRNQKKLIKSVIYDAIKLLLKNLNLRKINKIFFLLIFIIINVYIVFMLGKYIIHFKFLIGILFCLNLYAKDQPPEPVTWEKNVKQLLYDDGEKINDGSHIMKLETPYRALDAAMVPITVKFNKDQTSDNFIKSLVLVVDENPSPVVGKFNFSHKTGNPTLTTRIRVDKYTYVRAIAEDNNGKKFMISNYVKAAGGCSAPSLADVDAVMTRLGKMKMKFIESLDSSNSINKAKFLISHPNYSGLQFNQLTRSEIPAHFVNHIEIEQDGELILEVNPDISLSEDPSITFHYINSGGPLTVKVKDSEGAEFKKTFPLSQVTASKN